MDSLGTEVEVQKKGIGSIEYRIRIILLLLIAFGLVVTFDFAYDPSSPNFETEYVSNIIKFLVLVGVGITFARFLRNSPARTLAIASHILMPFALILLVATLLWGEEVNGARRWLTLFGLSFQTSEFFKFTLALSLAYALTPFSNSSKAIRYAKLFFWFELIVGLYLIYEQPNHSAVILITITIFLIAFLSRVKWYYVVVFGLITFLALGILVMKDPEKSKRVKAFRSKPSEQISVTLSDERFQAREALKAVASGGWFGRGIGRSIAKYSIPAASTDFVFAIIVEEFGFVGGFLLILCFYLIIDAAYRAALKESNEFLRLSSLALITFFALNVIIHIAVNLDCGPTTGVPLPFISQGGTSLFFNLLSMGIILKVAHNRDLDNTKFDHNINN